MASEYLTGIIPHSGNFKSRQNSVHKYDKTRHFISHTVSILISDVQRGCHALWFEIKCRVFCYIIEALENCQKRCVIVKPRGQTVKNSCQALTMILWPNISMVAGWCSTVSAANMVWKTYRALQHTDFFRADDIDLIQSQFEGDTYLTEFNIFKAVLFHRAYSMYL